MPEAPAARGANTLIILTFVVALVAYAAFALLAARWWISGLAAPLVALLLATRQARARFSAYVFFSVVGVRTAITGHWGSTLFALGAIVLMESPAALRVWPRLGAPARMARP
ncbi:MAG: hypothetical protein AUH81_06650 [Candidatus Rokubacteria bacterium 13_1_40CM_4_69_5]|nr:MAG: hypothetical protein AUH81_06650 [Candidatus Rokubacteria bacterium 13_1_40CM_4_69_5]